MLDKNKHWDYIKIYLQYALDNLSNFVPDLTRLLTLPISHTINPLDEINPLK